MLIRQETAQHLCWELGCFFLQFFFPLPIFFLSGSGFVRETPVSLSAARPVLMAD